MGNRLPFRRIFAVVQRLKSRRVGTNVTSWYLSSLAPVIQAHGLRDEAAMVLVGTAFIGLAAALARGVSLSLV
jgi:hypothetical protein